MADGGRKYPPEVLTPGEARAIVNAPNRRAPTGIRNRALFATFYRAGLRCSEALALRPKDVDLEAGTITVLHGKGDRRRVVAIDDGAVRLIERWMDVRRDLKVPRNAPVFCTLKGGPVSPDYVRAAIKRAGRRAGIDKRVHAHGLRHTHAAELANEGVPVNVIQQQLGHANLATTDIYLSHVAPTERVERIRAREWTP